MGIFIFIGAVAWHFWSEIMNLIKRFKIRLTGNIESDQKDEIENDEEEGKEYITKFDLLLQLEIGNTLRYLGGSDLIEDQVKGKVLLTPLTQNLRTKEWIPKSEQESLIVVTNSFWIVNISSREGSERIFLLMKPVTERYGNLSAFYIKGKDGRGKGPAKIFNENSQITQVKYTFPEEWGFDDESFNIVDIGAFRVLSGEDEENNTERRFFEDDLIAFVTSKSESGKWLLFLDPRDKSKGNGAFLMGEKIDEEMIESPY